MTCCRPGHMEGFPTAENFRPAPSRRLYLNIGGLGVRGFYRPKTSEAEGHQTWITWKFQKIQKRIFQHQTLKGPPVTSKGKPSPVDRGFQQKPCCCFGRTAAHLTLAGSEVIPHCTAPSRVSHHVSGSEVSFQASYEYPGPLQARVFLSVLKPKT